MCCAFVVSSVELVVERSGQTESFRIKRGGKQATARAYAEPFKLKVGSPCSSDTHKLGTTIAAERKTNVADFPITLQSYQELPFYLSEVDKKNAVAEVATRVAELRKGILSQPTKMVSWKTASCLFDGVACS